MKKLLLPFFIFFIHGKKSKIQDANLQLRVYNLRLSSFLHLHLYSTSHNMDCFTAASRCRQETESTDCSGFTAALTQNLSIVVVRQSSLLILMSSPCVSPAERREHPESLGVQHGWGFPAGLEHQHSGDASWDVPGQRVGGSVSVDHGCWDRWVCVPLQMCVWFSTGRVMESSACVSGPYGHTIKQYSPSGKLLQVLGSPGKAGSSLSPLQFDQPAEIFIHSSGEIYIVDGDGGMNNRLIKLSRGACRSSHTEETLA